jgi:hypothetical protein
MILKTHRGLRSANSARQKGQMGGEHLRGKREDTTLILAAHVASHRLLCATAAAPMPADASWTCKCNVSGRCRGQVQRAEE